MQRRTFLKQAAALTGAGLMLSGLPLAARAENKRLYVDGLSFLPDDLADVPASGLVAFIADVSRIEKVTRPDGSINYKRTYKACMEGVDEALALVATNTDTLYIAKSGQEVLKPENAGKCGLFLQLQGADSVEDSIDQLDDFAAKGLRILQLTHHYGNRYAGGALDKVQTGLTAAGRELVVRMNERGVLLDVSHSSPLAALEAAELSRQPILQSHGAARAIVNHARCSPDAVIRAIADTGGVFGVFMMSFWLTTESVPTVDHYIAQLRHVANVGGVDAVAVANDFPLRGQENLLALGNDNKAGVEQYLPWWDQLAKAGILGFEHRPEHVVIPEFNTIDRMARIDHALGKAGFTGRERDKIMGANLLRVL